MAPTNFEDSIREKMQERELQPSADAWKKLESKLGAEKKPVIGKFGWYAIAASFVGILILASVFLKGRSIVNANDGLVEEENELPIPILDDIRGDDMERLIDSVEEVEPIAIEENISEEENLDNPNRSIKSKNEQSVVATTQIRESIQMEDAVANAKVDPKVISTEEDRKVNAEINQATFIDNKVDEVVAEVQNKLNTNETVTAEEIDALLQAAQTEISNRRILNTETNKVDAAALLMDVEFELERGFRDRVFDALGDSFKKIRTAVAERNN